MDVVRKILKSDTEVYIVRGRPNPRKGIYRFSVCFFFRVNTFFDYSIIISLLHLEKYLVHILHIPVALTCKVVSYKFCTLFSDFYICYICMNFLGKVITFHTYTLG